MKKYRKIVFICIACLFFISGCMGIGNWPKVKDKHFVDNKGYISGHFEVSTKNKVLGNAAIIYYIEQGTLSDKAVKKAYNIKFTKKDALKIAKTFDKYGGELIKDSSYLGNVSTGRLLVYKYKYTNAKSNDYGDYLLCTDFIDKNGHSLTIAWYKEKILRIFIM